MKPMVILKHYFEFIKQILFKRYVFGGKTICMIVLSEFVL